MFSDAAAPTVSDTWLTYGALFLDFTVDFYGFNSAGANAPTVARPIGFSSLPPKPRATAQGEQKQERIAAESKSAKAASAEEYELVELSSLGSHRPLGGTPSSLLTSQGEQSPSVLVRKR
jgi:hypothetical protein